MEKIKKILVVSHSSELGGAERSMIDLFDKWKAQNPKLDFHFVIKGPAKILAAELKKRNWSYTPIVYSAWSRRVPLDRNEDIFRNALYDTRATLAIEQLIDSINPDVVMTNTIVAPWGAFAAKLKGTPHVWFVREYGDLDHGHTMDMGTKSTFQDIDYFSDLIVTNSKTLEKHVRQYMPKANMKTVYTPFDIDWLNKKSKESIKTPFKYSDSLKIVVTGRVSKSKGQSDAAMAVGELIKSGANVELCIVGAKFLPDDDKELIAAIQKYDIADRVHLVGQKGNPLPYVAAADIAIMSSRMEAFGRTTFEYIALGKPVVGANGGATPEMIKDGKNGFIFDLAEIGDLTKNIKKYLDKPELIHKHSVAAKKTALDMMNGQHSAAALLDEVYAVVKDSRHEKLPNIARTWIGYPSLAQDYISDSGAVSLKRILYIKLRQRAKVLIVAGQNIYTKRGRKK